ncbi:50S ribosomal subunit protein L15 [Azospirillaceae bacterium]
MKLNQIRDNAGARQARTRVGRGIGCTKGKTCGRGVKGQGSRTGVAIKGFEGGQMPLHRRLPKRGFTPLSRSNLAEVNIGRVQQAIESGRLDAGQPITVAALALAGLVREDATAVRLLAKGTLKAKASFVVAGASKAAVAAVEQAGGSGTVAGAAA